MTQAIIGHTGFVGGNLIEQHKFSDFYNTKNINDIIGKKFDTLVCCGIPAEKWKANQQPENDYRVINQLLDNILQVNVKKLILISTVDVYKTPYNINEDTLIDSTEHQPYGKHRHLAEQTLAENFDTLIIRLPGLFGKGLKKNIIFDFINKNEVEKIHSGAVFQFYYLQHLWHDVSIALENKIPILNISSEPIIVSDVAKDVFNLDFDNKPYPNPASYNMKSKYAELFGGSNGYLYDKDQIINDMNKYVQSIKVK